MLYLLLKIFNYKQLQKVNQGLTEDIQNNLKKIAESAGIAYLGNRDGNLLYALGDEKRLDPQKAIESVRQFYKQLHSTEEDLFGFNLLVSLLDEDSETAQKKMRESLLTINSYEEIWLEEKAEIFFSGRVASRKIEDFWLVLPQTGYAAVAPDRHKNIWDREASIKRILKTVMLKDTMCLYISGSNASERRLLVDSVLSRFLEKTNVMNVPRIFTLFNRRSVIHPFLNSIDPEFLNLVDQFLYRYELNVWNELGDLLSFLKNTPTGNMYPDHLSQDFHLAYQLYLIAYFRMMEENLLPPILVCEDIETYNSHSLKALKILLKGFSRLSSFKPILTSGKKGMKCEFNFLKIRTVSIRPLSPKKIRGFSSKLVPALNISEKDSFQIQKYTKGHVIPLVHFLKILEKREQIPDENGSFSWIHNAETIALFSGHPIAVSWYFINYLPEHMKRFLYIIYLQAGLLNRLQLTSFLYSQGLSDEIIFRSLTDLIHYGLIASGEYVIPLFPAIREKLKKSIISSESNLEEEFTEFLIGLWRGGSFPHLVLLFFFLLNMKESLSKTAEAKYDRYALEILVQTLERKIAELDFEGVQLLLNQKHLSLLSLSPDEQRGLKLFIYSVKIRSALLSGNIQEVEDLHTEAVVLSSGYRVNPLKGRLFLQIARFYEMKGDPVIALDWAKKSLIQFQNSGVPGSQVPWSQVPGGELLATIEIGSAMLALGKIEEALEYFSFSDQVRDSLFPIEELRASALKAVALFIKGNLSRAQTEVQKGLEQAQALKRREWELFLDFLDARILFELGACQDAIPVLLRGLAMAELYSIEPAKKIFYRWLGRSYAYMGRLETAESVLDSCEDAAEKLYFLGEVHFFRGDNARALEACESASSLTGTEDLYPGERILWTDGFAAVEGRCFSLLTGSALLIRLIQSFKAYLQGLEGGVEQGIEHLYRITRGEKIPEVDPYLSIYHYFYASTLPDVGKGEVDDGLTVLNKALKLLQHRASNIENSTIRWQFLHKNFWNARLLEEAERKRLL